MASSWEQSAPPSEDLIIPFIGIDKAVQQLRVHKADDM
jgi:hypothetical protein